MLQFKVMTDGYMDREKSLAWRDMASESLCILSYLSLNDEEFPCPEVYNAMCNIIQNKYEEPIVKRWVGYAINTEIEGGSDMSDIYKKDWFTLYGEEFNASIWG